MRQTLLGDPTSQPALDPHHDRPPTRPLRNVVAVAAALTALLAIVAMASRGERVSPARGASPSQAFWDYVLSTYLVVGLAVFVTVMYLLIKERESLPTRRPRHRDIRQLIQFALVFVVLFAVGPYLVDVFRGGDGETANEGVQTRASDRDGRRRGPAAEATPDRRFRWEPVIVLGALGLVSVAALATMRSKRRRGTANEAEVADALASVLDDALTDLLAERDPRRAIIAAYARMERLLAAHGVPRDPAEAPFEYLARVLVELRASAASVFELTALFERAKFSAHEVDAGMKKEAVEALAAVRDELRERA